MAAPPPISLSLSLDSTLQPLFSLSSHYPSLPSTTTTTTHPFFSPHKFHPLHHKFSPPPPLPAKSLSRTSPFLDSLGLARLQTLENFRYTRDFDHGSLEIRPMLPDELDPTVDLLAGSFIESMAMPGQYVSLLAFLVRQYVMERRLLVPHTAILVGFYRGKEGGESQLVCTAEVSFDARGSNPSPPTPTPPKDCPYVCNITVRKELRRRGIGWELLRACEELISRMKTSRKVYLHCRLIDTGPLNMYKKAGYKAVKKDTILIWFSLQRRKYLMFKELPVSSDDEPSDSLDVDDQSN